MFSDEESEQLIRGFLTPRLFEAGLICRADDRGDPPRRDARVEEGGEAVALVRGAQAAGLDQMLFALLGHPLPVFPKHPAIGLGISQSIFREREDSSSNFRRTASPR